MNRLAVFLFVLLAVLAGAGVGIGRMAQLEGSGALQHNGSWWFSKALTNDQNPLITAQVTAFALFALPPEEAVYLFARKDQNNALLTGDHTYTITGNVHALKARYWSITAYGNDLYLIPNEADRYSFNNTNLKTDSTGNFTIHLSPRRQGINWLPVAEGKRFNLVLRLYQSERDLLDHLDRVSLPVVKRTEV